MTDLSSPLQTRRPATHVGGVQVLRWLAIAVLLILGLWASVPTTGQYTDVSEPSYEHCRPYRGRLMAQLL